MKQREQAMHDMKIIGLDIKYINKMFYWNHDEENAGDDRTICL